MVKIRYLQEKRLNGIIALASAFGVALVVLNFYIMFSNFDHLSGSTSTSTSETNTMMNRLSTEPMFFSALQDLYYKYGSEIAELRPAMKSWCEITKSCKFTDYEAEMLYMLIREYKPQNVFEMAPNRGYSSHWILHALH